MESLFGLGFRPPYYSRVVEGLRGEADFFEIVSENFMAAGGRPRRFLSQLKERYPVFAHGVGMSIAGPAAPSPAYLAKLRDFIRWLRPQYVSDHLCWTGLALHNAHDLFPVPLTAESLTTVAERVKRVQETLDHRLLLENASAYVRFAADEMTEAEFFRELVARTGCGVLLDVNNLFVNCNNLAVDPYRYLETLPRDCVGYFHLAGHSVRGNLRIDTHDAHPCEEVWDVYRAAVRRFERAPTLVEWDDNYPPYEELEGILRRAKAIRAEALVSGGSRGAPKFESKPRPPGIPTGEIMGTFHALAVQTENVAETDARLEIVDGETPVGAVVGMNVYNDAYFARIRDTLGEIFPTIKERLGCAEAFGAMVMSYLEHCPPASPDIKFVGARMEEFLQSHPELSPIAALEWARFDLYDIEEDTEALTLEAFAGRPNDAWADSRFTFRSVARLVPGGEPHLVFRKGEDVFHEPLDAAALAIAEALNRRETLETIFSGVARATEAELGPAVAQKTMAILSRWVAFSLVTEL